MAITAKAPALESFNICLFFSGSAWLDRASTVSQNPSIWIPPDMMTGITARPAALARLPSRSCCAAISHTHMAAPMTAPINGSHESM